MKFVQKEHDRTLIHISNKTRYGLPIAEASHVPADHFKECSAPDSLLAKVKDQVKESVCRCVTPVGYQLVSAFPSLLLLLLLLPGIQLSTCEAQGGLCLLHKLHLRSEWERVGVVMSSTQQPQVLLKLHTETHTHTR